MSLLSVVAIVLSILALKKANEVSDRLDIFENKNKQTTKAIDSDKYHVNNQHVKSATIDVTPESHTAAVDHLAQVAVSSQQTSQLKVEGVIESIHTHVVEEYKEPAFITWLKEDWLLKLGGVLVIMGVLFFLSIAFESMGAAGKIAVGYLFGISFMVFGFMYAKKQIVTGSSIHLVGAVIIILSSYVAHQPNFNVFNAYFAMVMMFLTTVCIALTSYMYNRAPLAHVGLFIAGLVPVLTRVSDSTFFEILVYLAVVITGVVWLAFVTRWRSLILMSLAIVSIYSISYITGGLGDSPLLFKEMVMVAAFGTLFFITSLFSILRTEGYAIKDDGIVALLNAGYALLWITSQAQPELAPILIATVGLIYAVGFFFVYKVTNVYTSFLIYGGVALGMLTTSIMLEISGRALAVTLLLIGAGVSCFTYHLSRDVSITKVMSFFHVLPLIYVIISIANIANLSYPQFSLFDAWKDLLIIGMAIVVYAFLYQYFKTRIRDLSNIAHVVVVLLIIDVIWQVLHLVTSSYFATELSTLIIGIGLTMYIYYLTNNNETTEKTAVINSIAFITLFGSLTSLNSAKDWIAVSLGVTVSYFLFFFFSGRIKTIAYSGLASGLFLVAVSIWQLAHTLIPSEGLATFVSILIYTVVGLQQLWKGSLENNDIRIRIARVWLGFVAARVIFIDAWQSGNVAVGVLICIVIGVLLLSSAFIIKKATAVEK